MDPDENSSKRFKSSSLDDVLEIFSTFSEPPVQSSVANIIKKEIDDFDSPVKYGERYAHIMMKETLVEEDDLLEKDKTYGIKALVGNNFIKQTEVDNEADTERRIEILTELEVLRKQVHFKFLEKEADYNNLKLLYDELKMKNGHDEEFENEVKAVLKIKQDKILELEKELKVFKDGNVGFAEITLQNKQLREGLEKKDKEVKVMEERINHVKELVSVSAEKIKTVKQKEDHFKNVELENVRLQNLLIELKNQSSDMLRKVDTMAKEIKAKDDKITILKETNANLEQEVNIAMDSSDKSDNGENLDSSQMGIKVRDEEISSLREKVRTLTSQTHSLQNKRGVFSNSIEVQLIEKEAELNILKKDKQTGDNQMIKKYESILIEKDKELFKLKDSNLVGPNNDQMKAEFKFYFDELERKSQQFISLIKEQQNEIYTLRKQQLLVTNKQMPIPIPPIVPKQFRPNASQVPNPMKERLGHLSGLTIQTNTVNSPVPAPHSTPSPLPDLVSFSLSNAGVSQYDLAPKYYPSQQPPTTPSQYPGNNQTTSPMLQPVRDPIMPVPEEALLDKSLPLDLPLDMPVLLGTFSFD